MGLDFIRRTLKTSGLLLLVFFPFGLFYVGVFPTLAIFFGGVWGMLNLIFITALVRATVRPEGVDKGKAIGLAVVKFPLLYASLYGMLKVPQFDPLMLLIGFSVLMVVMVLKVAGRGLTQIYDRPKESTDAQGAS